jgi:hypothetical protein
MGLFKPLAPVNPGDFYHPFGVFMWKRNEKRLQARTQIYYR